MRNKVDPQYKAFSRHFSARVSPEIVDFANNVALLNSRYMFTERRGKQQYGYCTHCHQEHETEGLHHGHEAQCPSCHSVCKVRASGISRKKLMDEMYLVFYEKSLINPEAITARGMYLIRDYRNDYRNVKTQFITRVEYLFEPGNPGVMYENWAYYSHDQGRTITLERMERTKSVRSLISSAFAHTPTHCAISSIKKAVKDTPYQYSTWEQYLTGRADMVKFFDLFSRYPSIEYLTKLGLKKIVESKLHGDPTYSAINWKGKTLYEVLHLNKAELQEFKNSKLAKETLELRLFQIAKQDKSNLSIKQLNEIAQEYGMNFKSLQVVLKYTTLARANAYIMKQYTKGNEQLYTWRYEDKSQILNDWRDYLNDCITLNMPLTDEIILYPKNLHEAHQATIEKIQIKEDIAFREKFEARHRALKQFQFEANGIFLRPVLDQKELIEEGNKLKHCVGNYAKQYVNGETNLFVLRKIDQPDTPFYTIEIQKEQIRQCRGLKNCNPTPEVDQFIQAFKAAKLEKEQTKNRIQVRQEVAI